MDESLAEAASPRRLWAWAILIAAAGVAVRMLWYVRFRDETALRTGPDGAIYIGQAKSFLNGAIADPAAQGLANVYREAFAPGYALFVAGLWEFLPRGDVYRDAAYVHLVVYAAQWLLVGATTLMGFALARRVLFGWSALAPVVLVTLSLAFVDMPNMFAYESLLAFLLTACVLLLVKTHEHCQPPVFEGARFWQQTPPGALRTLALPAAGGLALSAAILVQPRVALLLPFAAVWLVSAALPRCAVLFTLLALVLPAGWVARDYWQFGELVPISINTQASLYTDNVDPLGGDGYVPEAAPPACPRDRLLSPDFAAHFAWGRCMQGAGVRQIAAHPADSALAVPDRVAALFSPWDPRFARGQYASDQWGYQSLLPAAVRADGAYRRTSEILAAVFVALYILLVAVGVYALWSEGAGAPSRMIALPVLTLPLVHLAFHAENRFRLPLLPLLAIAVTLGALFIWDALASGRRGRGRMS